MNGESATLDKVTAAKKICIALQSDDRKVRKNAFIDFEKFLSDQNLDFSNQDLRDIFNETHMYTLQGFWDKTEAVRSQAIIFCKFLIVVKLPLNDYYLTYIFPVITERIGTVEIVEESEEIRLQLVELLEAIIIKYSNTVQLKPFLGECVTILAESVKDKFPSIKELSCKTIIKLAEALPKDFHLQAATLVKPILTCFTHQRYRVRVKAIKAIGEVILHTDYKQLDVVLQPLAEKLFDQIPIVRRTVAEVAANWLMVYRDRYSFFAKIMPLLLTGLNDEVEETRIQAHELWEKVGLQYMEENEKDFKDQLDFVTELPKYYPANCKRPNLGCRSLIQRNVGKIAPALSKELMSWNEDIRFRCSQLLCSITLLAEDGLTMYLQDLLPAMYSSARDEDSRVVVNIAKASETIGLFVPFDTWSKFALPAVAEVPHFGHLLVLANLIKGSPQEYVSGKLLEIAKLLAEDYICCTRKKQMQRQLLNCVQEISKKYEPEPSWENTSYYLFKVIVILLALRDRENEELISSDLFEHLAKDLHLKDDQELWNKYTRQLLQDINIEPKLWTKITDECCIFLTILTECHEAFGKNLDLISEILLGALNTEADGEQRLNTLFHLSEVFNDKDKLFKNTENVTPFLEKLIVEIFVPSLVWHAGATAEAIRTMAALCLKYALQPSSNIDLFPSGEVLRGVMDKLLPLLLSLVEDASFRSRQLAVECIVLLKENAVKKNVWNAEDVGKVYPEILKRLDDPTERVRLTTLKSLPVLLSNSPENFKDAYFRAHHELIVDSLLTHFDDDDEIIQNLVFDVLKVVATINKEELLKKVQRHKRVLRNKTGCDKIIEYAENLA
ncbi:dynein axonemal assembly factor 5 isoform X2 [Aethina tumida]|uniref:dynein axonemal assembly factor 5 isoform X2 n=1 Tax=Aethina tumida TaxID=116153 RepID=UPI00214974FF|nr:dynein axonemal assembly factor 5 isoform X2 [Aethina tumida]